MVLYYAGLTNYFINRLQKQGKLKAMMKKKACHTGYDRLQDTMIVDQVTRLISMILPGGVHDRRG
jgi:hypothetical protein